MTPVRWVLLGGLAAFMTGAGLYHFANPDAYEALIPPILPAKRPLVYVSGVLEIGFGLALLVPAWRPRAAIGVIVTLIVIFPANIWMALQGGIDDPRVPASFANPVVAWARLPFQGLFIWWASIFVRN